MITSTAHAENLSYRQFTRPLALAGGLSVLAGFVWGNSAEQFLAYLLIVSAAVLPSVLWIRMGASGIPILPVVSLAYIPYFGWPILSSSESTLDYTALEILYAAFTVALFLLTATAAWRLMAGRVRRQRHAIAPEKADTARVVQFVFAGLLAGLIFHIGVISGSLAWLGSYFGLVRTVAVTFVMIACFLLGVSRAQGLLRGKSWAVATGGVALLIILSWSSLFLVGGIVYSLAVVFGYVIIAKRMPWLVVGAVLVAVTVLHAGKGEMRARYWESGTNYYGGGTSVFALPGFAAEWVAEGLATITSGSDYQTPLDRAGLIHMILRVQSETPDRIEFLKGATYSLLPAILVPRFIDAEKPASQVGMDLLNIHYGILTVEGAAATAVGWGLVAEAYANFGDWGVIGIGLMLGALCGLLQSWSTNAGILALPTLTSIAVLMTLINLEGDFIQVCLSLLQAFTSVLIFFAAFRWFAIRRNPRIRSGTGAA